MNYGQVDGSPFSRVSGDPFAGSPVSTREWRTSQPGSPSTPISLVDDSDSDSSVTLDNDSILRYDVEDVIDLEELNSRPERTIPRKRRASGETIDLTSDPQDSFNEGDFLTDEALERIVSTLGREERIEPREPDRPNNRRVVGEACVNGILYKAGQSVELRDKSYLRIFGVLEDTTGSLFFHGRRLFKLTSLAKRSEPKGYLPRWKNELVWIENDTSDIPLGDIRRFVSISFTNDIKSEESQRESDRGRRLFCRLKEVAVSNQVSVQYLSYHETDEMSVHRSPPWLLRQDWRGATRIFGETNKTAPSAYAVRVINLEDSSGPGIIDLTVPDTSESVISRLKDGRQYTFGDGFCGAGGVSAGARKAGLAIKWGFDKSRHAMDTYRLNFKEAICETSDIFHFLTNDPEEIKVDICHGSPPCQTFSAAHTVEAATDDANFACIFSCADLMKKVRPRILTMEETSGLYERHRDVFHRVIQSFLEIGYSVRWGLLKCVDYGVPQLRRRLIIIASG